MLNSSLEIALGLIATFMNHIV